MLTYLFFCSRSGDHRDLHVLTHPFPTRRSSDLLPFVSSPSRDRTMTNSSLSQGIAPFRAIEISHLARKLRAEGRSVIHMEFGQPSDGAPAGAVAVARAALGEPDMGYLDDRKGVV